jgi:hypothetical protein
MNFVFIAALAILLFGVPTLVFLTLSKSKKLAVWLKIFGANLILFSSMVALLIYFTASYYGKHDQVIISDTPITITSKPITLKCVPPLSRDNKDGDIRLLLKEKWSPVHPWKQIKLDDNTLVSVNIILTGQDGSKYSPCILGSSGMDLLGYFKPAIPKDVNIMTIQLSASAPLTCQKVTWHDWNRK